MIVWYPNSYCSYAVVNGVVIQHFIIGYNQLRCLNNYGFRDKRVFFKLFPALVIYKVRTVVQMHFRRRNILGNKSQFIQYLLFSKNVFTKCALPSATPCVLFHPPFASNPYLCTRKKLFKQYDKQKKHTG